MIVVGILGGVASGKSFVAGQLVQLGARSLDVDRMAHAVLREPEVREKIAARWGAGVLDPDGAIMRPAVAAKVFQPGPTGAKELTFLEELTHPRIGGRIREQLANWQTSGEVAVAVLDAAVLLKAGWQQFCDKILYVEVSRQLRWERAAARGWSDSEFAAREAAQESLDVKRSTADWVIDNGGTPAATLAQVQEFWRTLPIDPPASTDS